MYIFFLHYFSVLVIILHSYSHIFLEKENAFAIIFLSFSFLNFMFLENFMVKHMD